ncbi:MAG: sugar transferase [Elusimicrobia bacterium]|nr:sugar transferase [Elusimicrobiota bacterium]
MPLSPPPLKVRPLKRLFDVVVSLTLLLLLGPFILTLIAVLWVRQRLSERDAGPVFYGEIRVSHGRQFRLLKFRTVRQPVIDAAMAREGAQRMLVKPFERDSGNLTALGRILQNTYADELPQLLNVLRGDMSLVGPRPWRPFEVETVPRGAERKMTVPCGLTGLFQSYKGGTASDSELDLQYIEAYRSKSAVGLLWFDLTIIARTLRVLLQAKGL